MFKTKFKKTMNDYIKIRNALDRLIDAKKDLRKLGVLRSERTIGEYGEWFAEKMTGGSFC